MNPSLSWVIWSSHILRGTEAKRAENSIGRYKLKHLESLKNAQNTINKKIDI